MGLSAIVQASVAVPAGRTKSPPARAGVAHPIIVKYGNEKINDAVRNENIANFVLLMVAHYYAQKEAELQPEDEQAFRYFS